MLDFISDLASLFGAFDHKNGWHIFFVAVIVFALVAAIAWFLTAQ